MVWVSLSRFLFGTYWKLLKRSKALDYYHFLLKRQFDSPELIREEQERRLKALLEYSYRNIPYYKDLFNEHNIDIKRRTGEEVLKEIPFLTKEIIKKNFNRLWKPRQGVKWYFNASGGSTGVPVKLVQDSEYADWRLAATLLFDEWAGCQIGEPRILLWGSPKEVFQKTKGWKTKMHNFFSNDITLNAFKMSTERMGKYMELINTIKPTCILAYADAAFEFAEFIEKTGKRVHKPRSIITSAGLLTPEMRETIEGVFQCPVFNRYGSREVGAIACECEEHVGLHISDLTQYIEVINADGKPCVPGEMGEIVITSLVNYTMPLIRYKIEDMGTMSSHRCPCGRGFSLLEQVTGRTLEMLVNKKGELISGTAVTLLFYFKDSIKRYQIVQEDIDKLVIYLELIKHVSYEEYQKDIHSIENSLKVLMGEETKIDFQVLEQIEPSPSGKYQYIISRVRKRE